MSALARFAALAATLGLAAAAPLSAAHAGICEGTVVGVASLNHYNHFSGSGFLAVRTGPGSGYHQIGELYRHDHVEVTGKSGIGIWPLHVGPLHEPAVGAGLPQGWVYGCIWL